MSALISSHDLFAGEVLALPLEMQVRSAHPLLRLPPVRRLALCAGRRRMGWGRRGRDGERCWVLRILILSRPLARGMVVSRLLPFLVQDAAAGQALLVPLEPRLRQTDETWVGHCMAIRDGQVAGNAHIDSHCQA